MRYRSCPAARVAVFAALALLTVTPAAAQAPLDTPRLSLGIAAGTDDYDSELQLKLALPPGVAIGRIEAVLTYAAETLQFQKVAGHLIDQAKIRVNSRVEPADGGKRELHLVVESASAGLPLPTDTLAKVVLRVAKGVKPTVLDVGLRAKVFTTDGGEVTPVAVYPGRINVQERAVFFGCFFYMH